MASDSIPVVPQSTSDEENRIEDAHSKDLEESNSMQQELSQNDQKRSSPSVYEMNANRLQSISTGETESTEIIQSDLSEETALIQASCFETTKSSLVIQSDLVEETQSTSAIHTGHDEENKLSEINQRDISEEKEPTRVIQPVLVKENEVTRVIQPVLVGENEVTQVIQPVLVEENSIQKIQPVLVEENDSIQVTQSVLVEKNESSLAFQPAFVQEKESTLAIQSPPSEENESTEVIHASLSVQTKVIPAPISEESVSTTVIQPIFSEKTMSSELSQPALSEKTELTEVKQQVVSDEVNLSKEVSSGPSKSRKEKLKLHIPSNNTAFPIVLPKDPSSFFHPALDMENFLPLLDTEEYKNAQLYEVPGSGHVIVTPTTPCEPIFPDFVISSLLPSPEKTSSESVEPSSPTKDSKVTENVCSEKSLYTLETMISHWIQRGMEKYFNNLEDLIDYSKNELHYGLDLLQQMTKRVETLLNAAEGLPDPSTIWKYESGNLKNLARPLLIDTGVKMRRRLKDLEGETIEHYIAIFSVFPYDAGSNNESSKQPVTEAKKTLVTFFLKLSEDFMSLSDDVENFREHIRSFCTEIDRLL